MRIDALDILPQRPPFVMIDALNAYEESRVDTSFVVREDNILVKDGFLSEAGVMENIAQTCAARIGYIS
ncbi:MAG: pseudouridylate synthase, partial [Bacteroidales bacterium]|nr:pseudouridylate synthase [Bacteroidales bacterium]